MEKTALDLFEEYIVSPHKFSNKYKNNKRYMHKTAKCKEYVDYIDNILQPYYNLYGRLQFSHLFYIIKYGHDENLCKLCNKQHVMFLDFQRGYSKYCSYHCTIRDGSRVPEESKKIGTAKRKKKMKILLDNPIEGLKYREKLRIKSTESMNRPEEKERRSIYLKEKILKGEFTPNITNSWTHRESKIDDIPFRSSFEALFHLYNNCFKNKNITFEKLRIKYNFENKKSIYIVDFVDYHNQQVFEIKPKSLTENAKNTAKRNALLEWCTTNNYEYYEITEDHLKLYLQELIAIDYKHEFLDSFKRKYSKWLLI